MLLAQLGLAYDPAKEWIASSNPYTQPGPGFTILPAQRFSPVRVNALADGKEAGPALLDAALDGRSKASEWEKHYTLWVAFRLPDGSVRRNESFGWPSVFFNRTTETHYADVYALRGPSTLPRDRYADWSWLGAQFQEGDTFWFLDLTPLIFQLSLALAVPALVLGIWRFVCRRRRMTPATRFLRRVRLWAVFAVIACCLLSFFSPSQSISRLNWWQKPQNAASLQMTVAEVRALKSRPDGSQVLAQAIADVIPGPAAADQILVFGAQANETSSYGGLWMGWPLRWCEREWSVRTIFDDRGRPQPAEPPPAGTNARRYSLTELWIRLPASLRSTERESWRIQLGTLAANLLATWVLWRLSIGGCRIVERRITRGRSRRGECADCGYDLHGWQAERVPLRSAVIIAR